MNIKFANNMAIRYAKETMSIDGIIFNSGDIVPESMWPALDAREAAEAKAPRAITADSFPSENEEEEDDEEDEEFEVEIPLPGEESATLPKPDVDSAAPAKTEAPKADKKAGK